MFNTNPDHIPIHAVDGLRDLRACNTAGDKPFSARAVFNPEVLAKRISSEIPAELAEDVYERLALAGFKSYLFGGAIRDLALGELPKDWDIATDASSRDMRRLFPEATEISFEPGTFVLRPVSSEGVRFEIEITPLKKEYRGDILKRFEADNEITFNSMAYDFSGSLILDPYEGLSALRRRIIEVHDPAKIRMDIIIRLGRFIADYEKKYGFTLDSDTLSAAKAFTDRQSLNPESPELQTWKVLRALYYGLAAPDVQSALCWWDRIGLLDSVFFPEFKADKEILFKAAAKVSQAPVADRLKAFISELPEQQAAALKERSRKYLFPPVRYFMMDEIMRRCLDPLIPRLQEIEPMFPHIPAADASQESQFRDEIEEIETLACGVNPSAAFERWTQWNFGLRNAVLFRLPLPIAVNLLALKAAEDLKYPDWSGYAQYSFQDMLSCTERPGVIASLVFRVLISDPTSDYETILRFLNRWDCDIDLVLAEPVRSKVVETLTTSAEAGTLLHVLRDSPLLRCFTVELKREEFAAFVEPYAQLLAEAHREQSGADYRTFTWITDEFGKLPDWSHLLLETMRSQHEAFCRTRNLPAQHPWRVYAPWGELAEDCRNKAGT